MFDTGRRWSELYRRVLLESDRSLLPTRIEEARMAIRFRARELWYAGSLETKERHDLDAALKFLGLMSARSEREVNSRKMRPCNNLPSKVEKARTGASDRPDGRRCTISTLRC